MVAVETWEEFAVVTGALPHSPGCCDAISPNVLTMALIGLGGLLTAIGLEWGLYLQVPAVIAALVGGVVSAWLFMMSTGDTPASAAGRDD